MKSKADKIDNLIDKKTISMMFGYTTVRSVGNLIERHPDFPRPAVATVGRGNKSMWLHADVAAWYKKHQQSQQLLKIQQSKCKLYIRVSVAKNMIDDALEKVQVMIKTGTNFGEICENLNKIKHLSEALDTSIAFNFGNTDYFVSNAAALIDVLSDVRLNRPRFKKTVCKYGETDFFASVIDHPDRGRGYSCRTGEQSAYIGAVDMIGFYGPILIKKIAPA